MKGYVMLPAGWRRRTKDTGGWIATALASARKLPAKEAKSRKK